MHRRSLSSRGAPSRTTPPRPAGSRLSAVALLLPLALLLAACGGGSDDAGTDAGTSSSSGSSSSSSQDEPSGEESSEDTGDGSGENAGTVEITVEGGEYEPTGERVEASVGDELVLEITSDAAGELHVHSTPEQEIAFNQGTTRASIPIQQPGVIEVEEHDSGTLILQIEAR